MFVLDDVAGDAHAESRALSGGLGGEEVLVDALFHLFGHSLTVVRDTHQNIALCRCHLHRHLGRKAFALYFLFLPYGLESVVSDINHCTAKVLGDSHRYGQTCFIFFVDAYVEAFVVGAHSMIRQPYILLHDFGGISG